MNRRYIDNGPAVDDAPQLGPQAVHHARQIDRNDLVPLVVVELRHGGQAVVLANDAGHVGGAVETAKLCHDGRYPGVDLGALGDVDLGDQELVLPRSSSISAGALHLW